MQTWDPLERSKSADAEVLSASLKRNIKNILKSYVGMYDSFSELIQNAMDSVDRRESEEGEESDYKKKIWLTIDLRDDSFTITDNGIAFRKEEFESFLAPDISFKEERGTRGNKGVGATYIAYGFDHLSFGTKGNGHEFVGHLVGGREWVEDSKGLVTRPLVQTTKKYDSNFDEIDRGSTFTLKFGGKHTRPKNLSWYTATTPKQWMYLLLIKTPLGSVSYLEQDKNKPKIEFDLKVIKKDGTELVEENIIADYVFPHSQINASVDLKEILRFQKTQIEKGKDAGKIPAKYTRSNGMYEFFSTDDLLKLRPKDEEFKKIISKYSTEAYGYFAYSTSVWDEFNDNIAKLRKSYRVHKGGLQLANNHMSQGELIVIPLTSNTGYQNQCLVVLHFRDADPDLGRKGFQPELKDEGEKAAVSIVNKFKPWKPKLLRSDDGSKPNIVKELALHEWIKEQEEHEVSNPLSLNNKHFFAPTNEISITSTPKQEQDVVVLFNQLIAGGVIRGINLLATSQIKQYDGIFRYTIQQPFENHIYDEENNPLGVQGLSVKDDFISPPKILEYKFDLDALFAEFESDDKNEKEIHLAVTWKMGDEWKKNYDVISLLDIDNIHQREFHGTTHILNSSTTRFHVIVLKELVEYLNDVEGAQEYQKATYTNE